MQEVMDMAAGWWPLIINAVKALIVLIVGWMVAGLVGRMVRNKVNSSPRIDKTLGNFAANIVRWVILLMVFIAVLGLFGIQATSLVAVLGAATLAIGMALQGTLADLAAGFMLILFRPYKMDDYVDIAGTSGTVKDINLFFTELATPDNIQIIVPNGQAWGAIIRNFSHHDTRRVDVTYGIDYDDDIEAAKAIILKQATADSRVMSDPEPWVRVTNLGDSSVDLTLRVWCAAADFWDLKWHLTQAVKEAFDAGGISIPYPTSVEIQKES